MIKVTRTTVTEETYDNPVDQVNQTTAAITASLMYGKQFADMLKMMFPSLSSDIDKIFGASQSAQTVTQPSDYVTLVVPKSEFDSLIKAAEELVATSPDQRQDAIAMDIACSFAQYRNYVM